MVLGTSEKSPAVISLLSPSQAHIYIGKKPLSLPSSRLHSPRPLSPSSYISQSSSLLLLRPDPSQQVVQWGAQSWTQLPRCASPGLGRGKDHNHLPPPAGGALPGAARGAHLWLLVTQLSTRRMCRAFPAEMLCSRSAPACLAARGYFILRHTFRLKKYIYTHMSF